MLFSQFKSQVESHGVKLPKGWGGVGGNIDRYVKYADLGHPGMGNRRDYTDHDVRLAVSWARVHEVVGYQPKESANMGLRASQLLTEYDTGWVVMSQWRVWWTDQPTKQVFDKGAVCLEVMPRERMFD